MKDKMTRDITKGNHFIKIVAGFKITDNQKQYLVYVEVPKKRHNVESEIYIGKYCFINNQNLLFKFETEEEKSRIFPLVRKLLSGEKNKEIETIEFDNIKEISVIGSNQFEDKKEMYPNFEF